MLAGAILEGLRRLAEAFAPDVERPVAIAPGEFLERAGHESLGHPGPASSRSIRRHP